MNQSKILDPENEKKFVMRHSFQNVLNKREDEEREGPIEYHFNVPWKIRISREDGFLKVFLNCMVAIDNENWSIHTKTYGKTIRKADEIGCGSYPIIYSQNKRFTYFKSYSWDDLPYLLNEGNYVFEFAVIILKATGVSLEAPGPLRRFDDELAKETSDVTLIVKDQKFHVLKMYLAAHSSYFKSLFLGNFSEAQKSEIELKDIDPHDFQLFLDLIYGELLVGDFSVLRILHLADFFDSKSAIRRCENFLLEKSHLSLKQKFDAATKYKLEQLKRKCVSQLKTHADILSIVPEDSSQFDSDLWKELLVKSSSLGK